MHDQKPDAKTERKIALCIAIGGGITAFVLCTIASYTPIIPYLWVGFISMIIYFTTGQQRSWTTAVKMFCSFIAGLIWGQISNLIYVFVFPQNHWAASILDYAVLIFLLLFIHLGLLNKTPFGFVPTVFLGLACTIGFFGRPFPFAGQGLMGGTPIWQGLLILIALFVFGVIFALMIQYIAAFFIPIIALPKRKGGEAEKIQPQNQTAKE